MEAAKHQYYSITDAAGLIKQLLKELPMELPAEAQPFKPLLKTQLLTQAASLGKDIRVELVLNFAKDDEAKEGAKAVNTALDMVRPMLAQAIPEIEQTIAKEVPELGPVVKKVQAALEKLKAEQVGTDVKLALHIDVNVVDLIATTLIPAVQKVRTA